MSDTTQRPDWAELLRQAAQFVGEAIEETKKEPTQ